MRPISPVRVRALSSLHAFTLLVCQQEGYLACKITAPASSYPQQGDPAQPELTPHKASKMSRYVWHISVMSTNLSKLCFPCWAHSLPASTSVWFLSLLCRIPPAYTYKCKDKRMLTWLEKNTMRNPSSTNLRSRLGISGVSSLHVHEISPFISTNSKLHYVSKKRPTFDLL